MIPQFMRKAILGMSMLLCHAMLALAQSGSPFTVLSNNADVANAKLYVEVMYEKSSCGDYKAQFRLVSKANPAGDVIPVDSFMNNPGTYETELSGADKYKSLMRPTAGGYRLRFALPASASLSDSFRICVDAYKMAYRCVGCAAGGSDAIFGPDDIDNACPYKGDDVLACYRRESKEANWEAWIQDPRDCQPYRVVAMPDGRWWFAQNLNYQKDLTMYAASNNGPVVAPTTADGGFWCPGGKSFTTSGVTDFSNATSASGGLASCKTYGALYSWTTANSLNGRSTLSPQPALGAASAAQGVCPSGWLMPSEFDWGVLLNAIENCPSPSTANGIAPCNHARSDAAIGFLGSQTAKSVLKTTQSCPPHANATDEVCAKVNMPSWIWRRAGYATKLSTPLAMGNDKYGFALLPAGYRANDGSAFAQAGTGARFWSAGESGTSGYSRNFTNNDKTAELSLNRKDFGQSVRCVKSGHIDEFFVFPYGVADMSMMSTAASVAVSCMDLGSGWSYAWTVSPADSLALTSGGATATLTNNSRNGLRVGSSYTITVVASKSGASSRTASKVLNISAVPPVALPTLGLAGIYSAPSAAADRAVTVRLSVYSAVQPAGATYEWKAVSYAAGAPAWTLGTTATPSLSTTSPNVAAATNYTITVTMKAAGYQTATTSMEYAVRGCNAIAQGAMPAEQTVCPGAGALATLNPTISGGDTYVFQWQQRVGSGSWENAPGTSTQQSYTPTAPTAINQLVYYRRMVTSCGQTSYSSEWKLMTYGGITQVPVAQITNCPNTATLLSMSAATGGGTNEPTYQWMSSTDNVTYANISGQAGRTYTPTSHATGGAFMYFRRIAIGNACTAIRDTSAVMSLRSLTTGVISQSSGTVVYVCPGQTGISVPGVTITSTVSPVPTPSAYQWQVYSNPTNTWTNVVGQTAAAYSGTVTASATPGYSTYYRRNAVVCGVDNWSGNVLQIVSSGNIGQPLAANREVTPGTAVTLSPGTATGGNSSYTYKWQSSPDNISWSDLQTAFAVGNANQAISAFANDTTMYYRRIAQSCTTPITHIGGVTTVTVKAPPFTQPVLSDIQTCPGGKVVFNPGVATGGTGITYQWQAFNANANAWSDMLGRTNDTLMLTAPDVGAVYSTYYRRKATSNGYSIFTSGARVYALPTNVVVGSNLKELYETSPNMPVVLAPTISGTGTIAYQWYSSTDNNTFAPMAGENKPTLTVILAGEGEYSPYYRLTAAVECGDVSRMSNVTRVSTPLTCPYKGGDLVEGSCVKRTTGAQNWQATIKDVRDARTYRVVQMPGGQWWFAQNLAHKNNGRWQYSTDDNPIYYETYGLQYPYNNQPCPAGWRAPEWGEDWQQMINCVLGDCGVKTLNYQIGDNTASIRNISAAINKLRTGVAWGSASANTGTDDYGFSLLDGGGGDRLPGGEYCAMRACSYSAATAWFNPSLGGLDLYPNVSSPPENMKQCCAGIAGYVRCVQDTMTQSRAPEKIEATYVAVTNGGSTTLTVVGARPAGGAVYEWGTGATPGSNIISSQELESFTVTLSATTTYWARLRNANGSHTSAATIEIKVTTCPYTQADLTRVTECRQRGMGVQNWEAYMQDGRAGDGNKQYRIVQMPDNQWWFAQNLNYTAGLTYNSTSYLPTTGTSTTDAATVKGTYWCPSSAYSGTSSANQTSGGAAACSTWGALYPWQTIMSLNGTGALSASSTTAPSGVQGVCPPNWHVPSMPEWTRLLGCSTVDDCSSTMYNTLNTYWLGGNARRLKGKNVGTPTSTSMSWINSNANVPTDDYGFALYPAGDREPGSGGYYNGMGIYALLYSTSENQNIGVSAPSNTRGLYLQYDQDKIYISSTWHKNYGFSMRCVADATPNASVAPAELWADYTTVSGGAVTSITPKGAALATGAVFQWGAGAVGSNIIGTTTELKYTITAPVLPADTTITYWCRVRNADGSTSEAATIDILVQNTTVCPYKGADLEEGSCRLRSDRAKNWTATVTDARDGKSYSIVLMPDGKWWHAQNLNYTDGLTYAASAAAPSTATGKNSIFKGYYWCPSLTSGTFAMGGGAAGCAQYGALYPWYTFMSMDGNGATYSGNDFDPQGYRGICPMGWHLSSMSELVKMFNCAEGNCQKDVYGAMKSDWRVGIRAAKHLAKIGSFNGSVGMESWDSYGFSKEASGYREPGGTIRYNGVESELVTSASSGSSTMAMGAINYSYPGLYTGVGSWFTYGFPVRCVSDGIPGIPEVTTAPTKLVADANLITSGVAVTLMASGGSMRPGAVYEWGTGNTAGANVIAGSGSSITVSPASTTTYWVRRVDGGVATSGLNIVVTVTACPYPGADLVAATCKTRAEGMKNWTARIQAGAEQYDVVQVGNMWVFAQDLRAATGTGANTRSQYGSDPMRFIYSPAAVLPARSAVGAAAGVQSLCPSGWTLPSTDQMVNLANCATGVCGTSKWAYTRYSQFSLFVDKCDYNPSGVTPSHSLAAMAACNNAWGANMWMSGLGNWGHMLPLVDGPFSNGYVAWTMDGISSMSAFGTNNYTWAGTSCNGGACTNAYIRCVRATSCTDNVTQGAIAGVGGNAMNPGTTREFNGTVTTTTGLPATFQWQISSDGTTWTDIAGATSQRYTYTTPNGEAPDVYLRRIASSNCGNSNVSAMCTITTNQFASCPYTGSDRTPASTCVRSATAPNYWTTSIRDARNGNDYEVVLLPSGSWWMRQMLRYGNCTTTGSNAGGSLFGNCIVCSGIWHYSHAAGMNGVGASNNATGFRGICPEGWHIPSEIEAQQKLAGVNGTALNMAEITSCTYADATGLSCVGNPNHHLMTTNNTCWYWVGASNTTTQASCGVNNNVSTIIRCVKD